MSTESGHAAASSGDQYGSTPPAWKDSKRYAWLLGLVVPLIPFICWLLVEATGLSVFWWSGPLIIFGIIPLFDLAFGTDTENPPEEVVEWLEQDVYYRWCTYLFIPLQFTSLIFACYVWGYFDLSLFGALGLAISVGSVSGIAIANAHELGHRRESIEKRLALIALAPSFYGHFCVEHNRGHHVRVATPEDPASARLGESFYQFLPRTMIGSLRSAWELECSRLKRSGKPVFSWHNDNLRAWSLSLGLFAGLCLVFGLAILPFLAIQAFFGACLLEVVNYLEHYGLLRQKGDDGRYERCAPQHSWNSNIVVSNVFLYHLQRHSDHHANPMHRYQSLRHMEEAPQLPGGYAAMVPIACVPPLWRRLMDKRVVEHYQGDVTKANIHPPARQQVLERWGHRPDAAAA